MAAGGALVERAGVEAARLVEGDDCLLAGIDDASVEAGDAMKERRVSTVGTSVGSVAAIGISSREIVLVYSRVHN